MKQTILIKNGIIIDPLLKINRKSSLLIKGTIIEKISDETDLIADKVIDAEGCFVCPGFIDMHVHLREPGFEYKETIKSGLLAAVRGGFTAVSPMPNTDPPCDNPEIYKKILLKAENLGLARVYPVAAITKELTSDTITPMDQLVTLGCKAFSNDGQPVYRASVMKEAMKRAKNLDTIIVDHCEEKDLVQGGVMHPCEKASKWGFPGITPVAEEIHIARDILLSAETGAHVHLAHVSTERGLSFLEWAKKRGVNVSAEVTPHHLFLSVDDMKEPDPDFKMTPPLRTPGDCNALIDALAEGIIDCIVTDHAPHAEEEKKRGFLYAPFGIVGLETAIPLVMDRLYHTGILSIEQIVKVMAINPSKLLHLPTSSLNPGSEANITIINPNREVVVDRNKFRSKSKNTPFHGWNLKGDVEATIVAGKIVFKNSI